MAEPVTRLNRALEDRAECPSPARRAASSSLFAHAIESRSHAGRSRCRPRFAPEADLVELRIAGDPEKRAYLADDTCWKNGPPRRVCVGTNTRIPSRSTK